jgi:hypothetical protein
MPQFRFPLSWRRYFYALLVISILSMVRTGQAAEFFCSAGNVTCLIAAINEANGLPGEHAITLEPGVYTLQTESGFRSGLPVITRSIRIEPSAENPATVIVRDSTAGSFRIFTIARSGRLNLIGITVQRGQDLSLSGNGAAIFNSGHTTLENSSVIESFGERGAVHNTGTLEILSSLIADNNGGHDGGGIVNDGGNVLVENSTLAHNFGNGPGAISSFGGNLVIKNSSIVFNSTNCCEPGGGIANLGGSVEISNTTIAKNQAGITGGGGIWNGLDGVTIIINSTIQENGSGGSGGATGGGILNDRGTLRLQNTIVSGNTAPFRPNCSGNIESLGNNFLGDLSGCGINIQSTDITGDSGLGALVGAGEDDLPGKAYYPVLSGSPVINNGNGSACPAKDQLGNPRVGRCDIGAVEFQDRKLVSIDIRPRSEANRINPRSNKKINVAILSINGFDATTVEPNTVRFGANGTEATPIHAGRRDVNGDGHIDQILSFAIQDTGIECGDISATLTAEIYSGPTIIGSSPITTTQCKTPKKNLVSQGR